MATSRATATSSKPRSLSTRADLPRCCALVTSRSASAVATRSPGPPTRVSPSWLGSDPRLQRLGIINFDAHLDLRQPERPGRGTSGTPFLQIAEARAAAGLEFRYLCVGASKASNTAALLARGRSLGAEIVFDIDVAAAETERTLHRFVEESSAIYLTFCLDVLPPAVAPGVSAPAGLGIALHRAMQLLRGVLASCRHRHAGSKLLLADVAELNPVHDVDSRTARTAARIVYEIAGF